MSKQANANIPFVNVQLYCIFLITMSFVLIDHYWIDYKRSNTSFILFLFFSFLSLNEFYAQCAFCTPNSFYLWWSFVFTSHMLCVCVCVWNFMNLSSERVETCCCCGIFFSFCSRSVEMLLHLLIVTVRLICVLNSMKLIAIGFYVRKCNNKWEIFHTDPKFNLNQWTKPN